MVYSIYETLWLFCIYAFLGWCVEVIYATVNSGKFVNRGFLNGPVCPIYGFGVTVVILCLTPLKDNLIILFIGSVILTSLMELVTGFILERIFNDKWWDYSDEHFNINGYICLKFSLIWGLACILVVEVVQPIIYKFINAVPIRAGRFLLSIFILSFIIDFIATVITISKFKKRAYLMEELVGKMRAISDEIGENISEGVLFAMEKQEEFASKVDKEKLREELEELKVKYESFVRKQKRSYEKIFKPFPDLQKGKYKNYIEKLKTYHKK